MSHEDIWMFNGQVYNYLHGRKKHLILRLWIDLCRLFCGSQLPLISCTLHSSAMAMVVRWLSACLCVFLLVSCGNGVQLSDPDENYFGNAIISRSLAYNSHINLLNGQDRIYLRRKRYLAGEFDDASSRKFSAAVRSNLDSFQDSGGKLSDGSSTTTSAMNDTNKSVEPDAARISSIPILENEPMTGGNYMSALNSSVNGSAKNMSSLNGTTEPGISPQTVNATVSITQKPSDNSNVTVSGKNGSSSVNVSTSTFSPVGKTNSNASGDDIAIANFPDKKLLTEHNITNTQEDSHVYYNSTFFPNDEKLGKYYWLDMDNHPLVQTNEMLSQSHRRAATVKLSFDFPFYGHTVRNITIATGGFLYTGDYVHSWLAATQYIAPLMANFDTSLSNDSYVKYMDNGTQFTVQWDKVKLQDRPESGAFTFQATLRKTGDITFVYQSVPVVISNITDDYHPVKVGLSDAYIIDRHVLFVRRKTIYEYHRIAFEHLSISNWTVIRLTPLPTCLEGTDCESCLSLQVGFDCFWCPDTNKCSNGIDRNRQEWLMNDCDRHSISNVSLCPAEKNKSEKSSTTLPSTQELEVHTEQTVTALLAEESSSLNVSTLIGVLFCVGILLSLSFWALYAYRNPHTTSGQFLIKYRPSQWSWRRGEARYTAATIHM